MMIRVVTLNVWGLPWPLAKQPEPRLHAIGEALQEIDAEVVALQEVWTAQARDALVEAGRRAGFDSLWHREATIGGSGLLVLSRLPIEAVHFEPYAVRGLPERILHLDYYAGKGLALVTVTSESGPVVIAVTHMHASYALPGEADEYVGHRIAQIVQFAHALTHVRAPVIALGDFNFKESEPAHAILAGLTGLADAAVVLDRRESTVFRANPYKARGKKPDRRIDYVFTRAGEQHGIEPVTIERIFDETLSIDGRAAAYSDHAGLAATLRISQAGAGVPAIDSRLVERTRELLRQGPGRANERQSSHRIFAGVAALTGGLTFRTARSPRVSRRRFVKAALFGTFGLSSLTAVNRLFLSENTVPNELEEFEQASHMLDELSTPTRPR